jgi:hypothetical protein
MAKLQTQKSGLIPIIRSGANDDEWDQYARSISQQFATNSKNSRTDLDLLQAQITALQKVNLTTTFADTTSGDVTITLDLLSDNWGKRTRIVYAKGTTNKVIINPHADDTNKLSSDGLATIWLAKLGDYIELEAHQTTGLWQIIGERISCGLVLNTYVGYGTTDNKIMKFTNSVEDYGNMFSHNHGAYGVHGLEITINRSGKYSIVFNGGGGASGSFNGLSVNSSQLTTEIYSITVTNRLIHAGADTSFASNNLGISIQKYFSKGDITRPHTSGIVPDTAAYCHFAASYLGN